MKEIASVAIVGAGTMGRRIGFQCARTQMQCRMFDTAPAVLASATGTIRAWLESKLSRADVTTALACVELCDELAVCVADADLVIENVPEDLELKRRVFAELDAVAPPHAVLATNSSSLPASRIASATSRPQRVVNVNFCNPPEEELLVELMSAAAVPRETVDAVERFLRRIGTVPIVTHREIMGFSFNRVWRAIKRECLHLVADGFASFEDLDRAWILSFGTRLGPFGMMDEIGLDVIRDIERRYFEDSGEERDRPPAFLDAMVVSGRLGRKSGRGFYTYPGPEFDAPGWLRKQPPWTLERAADLGEARP